jgi:hypothetical protein
MIQLQSAFLSEKLLVCHTVREKSIRLAVYLENIFAINTRHDIEACGSQR